MQTRFPQELTSDRSYHRVDKGPTPTSSKTFIHASGRKLKDKRVEQGRELNATSFNNYGGYRKRDFFREIHYPRDVIA